MRDENTRDPFGANALDADQLAELRTKLVAAAVAEGRTCLMCARTPAEIVLVHEVEVLVCPEHAARARNLHGQQVDFFGEEPDLARIIRWSPYRPAPAERMQP